MSSERPDLSEAEQKQLDAENALKEKAEQDALPYRWRQTLQDLTITIPVPSGTKSRDLLVDIHKRSIKLGLKGKEMILQGEFPHEIKVDESTWTLDDNKEVSLSLEKVNQQTWWPHVVTCAPKIDTTKITPENSKLSDLDGETRVMVEKMMFDNQQKQMGKPTSDERKKQEMLEKFKLQHPEMDFSKVKMG
ncbi:BQ5605_C003g01844 [Microbotryum silenes-dioicae]|uniref:Nuclear movement protein nudC n=1 Tax=Microbotryum silenes-dioicae TaxID=796604 RepID=A0A2X0M3I9_9BASI|nr:BQ5605_C003g01844 [Microbotryum silenes-dioicae]